MSDSLLNNKNTSRQETLEKLLAEKDKMIDSLNELLKEKNKLIEMMSQRMKERDKEVAIQRKAIDEQLTQIENIIEQRTYSIQKLNKDLEKKSKELQKGILLASKIQQAFLPKITTDLKELSIGTIYLALESIGGDYYDVLQLDEDHIGIVIVDVSGHGVSAAMVTSMAKISFSTIAKRTLSPKETCKRVNDEIVELLGDTRFYFTAFYLVYNTKTRKLKYTNCGHPKVFHYSKRENRLNELDTMGFFIGVFKEEAVFEEEECTLEPGDKLLLYTDGIFEAQNPQGEFFSRKQIADFVMENPDMSADDIVQLLFVKVMEFTEGCTQTDDICLVMCDIT